MNIPNMNNFRGLFRILFLSIAIVLIASFSFASVAVEKILPAVPEILPDKKNIEKDMVASIAADTEISQEKDAANSKKPVEAFESAADHPKSDVVRDEAKVSSGDSSLNKETVSPLGESYSSNKTAIKAIDKNIVLFRDRLKERFSIWLERSARYLDIMKDILREKELPEELVFLPIVESGFNLNAYSSARAVGPWQFMSATARRYGLVIDWWKDERKDPVKSTQAAADYLKDLYKMFGSWNLALAAYNAGEGRIAKALKRSDSDDYWSLLHTKQIRNETKEYVPRYIAATMIANTPEDYGFYNLAYHEPLEFDEVLLNSPLDIDVIAVCADTTVKEIRDLNPELRRWSTPPGLSHYVIRIPKGTKKIFNENLAEIPEDEQFSIETYKAKKGDNLKKIAKKVGVPVNAILAMNSMSGIEKIDAGEKIKIPPKDKYQPDIDDKATARKAAYKKKAGKKKSSKKSRKGHAKKSKGKKA